MTTKAEIIQKVKSLPMLPDVVLRVIKLSNDPDATIDQIIETMKLDQGITANVLRVCNSTYYGVSRRIESIRDAVVYLGAKTIVDIMMAGFCSDFFSRPVTAYRLEKGEIWKNAIATALSCQAVAEKSNRPGLDGALEYTAGLLHDIGKIILSENCEDEFDKIIKVMEEDKIPFDQAEIKVLGFSQSEIGAEIARMWRLSDNIVEAIEFQHNPREAKIDPFLTSCVHIGDLMSRTMGIGLGVDGLACQFQKEALDIVGLEMPDIMEVSASVLEQYRLNIDSITQVAE